MARIIHIIKKYFLFIIIFLGFIFAILIVVANMKIYSERSIITQSPCAPPCWHGLLPGKSTREQVWDFMQQSEFIPSWAIKDEENILRWFVSIDESGIFQFDENEILESIKISSNYYYNMQSILSVYGEPNAVYVDTARTSSNHLSLRISIYYQSIGLVIYFEFTASPQANYRLESTIQGNHFEIYNNKGSLRELLIQAHNISAIDIDEFMINQITIGWPGFDGLLVATNPENLLYEPWVVVSPTSNR